MKFLVPIYSCLQNPWLGGYVPRSPFSLSSVLNWICWTPPPKKNSWVRHWLSCTQTAGSNVKREYTTWNVSLFVWQVCCGLTQLKRRWLWILMHKFCVRLLIVGVCIHKHNGMNRIKLTAQSQSTLEPIIAPRRLNQWVTPPEQCPWLCGVMWLCCHSDSSLATKIRI